MTEAEWLAGDDATAMFALLRSRLSDRKVRLFVAGLGRQIWDRMDADQRDALKTAEFLADDLATEEERLASVDRLYRVFRTSSPADRVAHLTATMAVGMRKPDPTTYPSWSFVRQAVPGRQPLLLRCLTGNPFRPVALDASWLTSTVVALAGGIYEDRAFDRLPILADALMDAGCDDADVLNHCRGDGPHVRGCWVVDLILGKA